MSSPFPPSLSPQFLSAFAPSKEIVETVAVENEIDRFVEVLIEAWVEGAKSEALARAFSAERQGEAERARLRVAVYCQSHGHLADRADG